jgi:hypothetical protein
MVIFKFVKNYFTHLLDCASIVVTGNEGGELG